MVCNHPVLTHYTSPTELNKYQCISKRWQNKISTYTSHGDIWKYDLLCRN
uniref:Uncharacterized protein n=1 Tax=Anguilla anguilla TaxID=7936 RepID=A0A0E9XHW6_ANGAN